MTTSVLLRGADDSPVHLICVPHAGGGAASFNRWLGLFPTTIAVVRTQLPGREDRASEPHFRRVGEAVSALVSDICLLDSRVALYGHSMGHWWRSNWRTSCVLPVPRLSTCLCRDVVHLIVPRVGHRYMTPQNRT